MKFAKKILIATILLVLLVGCGSKKEETTVQNTTTSNAEVKKIDDLKIAFVPSRDAKDIAKQTEPIKKLLKSELQKQGYEVGNVNIDTVTNYEAAGEALVSGSVHVAFLPGGTYAAYYDKGVTLLLASVRHGLIYDSENPNDWNTGKPNVDTKDLVTYYRGIIVAGPSEKGLELANKVKAGQKLTWEDVSSAKWCVGNVTSGSGYQYPALWLKENFGKTFPDMANTNIVESGGYGPGFAKLALNQCDILPGYNDIRNDNDKKWVKDHGMKDIWSETTVIGVTDKIQNDTISASPKLVDDKLAEALRVAFLNLAKTPEGQAAIKIYNHKGYARVEHKDYEGAIKVNKLVQEMNR